MTNDEILLKDAVGILAGPTIANIKSRGENGHTSSSDIHSAVLKAEEETEEEIQLDINLYKENLFGIGKLDVSDEEFKSELEEMAPRGTFQRYRVALPSEQRKEFKDLKKDIGDLQKRIKLLTWATKERLVTVSPAGMWDELDNHLNRAVSKVEAAIEDVPNPSGGPAAKVFPQLLVYLCLGTFELYRPKEASSDEGSAFREYVSIIHELATGEREGEYVGGSKRHLSFEKPVKEVLKYHRQGKRPNFAPDRIIWK